MRPRACLITSLGVAAVSLLLRRRIWESCWAAIGLGTGAGTGTRHDARRTGGATPVLALLQQELRHQECIDR